MYDCCVGDFSGVRFLEANEMRDPHRSPQGVIVASSGQISELDIRRFLRHFLQVVRIFSKFSVVIIYPSFLLGTFTVSLPSNQKTRFHRSLIFLMEQSFFHYVHFSSMCMTLDNSR